MGKNPCFLFYPNDWERDLASQPLEIGGAWMLLLCSLYWEGGSSTKTLEEWSKIVRENPKKTKKIINFLGEKGIADLIKQNAIITITCRRMVRDAKIREIRTLAGKKGGNPALKKEQANEFCLTPLLNQDSNQTIKQKPTLSVSVPVSGSLVNQKADVFNVPSKEEIEHGSQTLLLKSIDQLSKHLKDENIFPDVYAFRGLCLKHKANLRAVAHTLTRCIAAKPQEPWGYCVAIMKKEDGNFNARDYEKTAR
jgi:hypothetical protein